MIQLLILEFLFITLIHAQYTSADVIPLPASKLATGLDIRSTPALEAGAILNPLPFVDEGGRHLNPQPSIAASNNNGLIHLDLANLHFWGKASMQLQVVKGSIMTFTFFRGPSITPLTMSAEPGTVLQTWVYNRELEGLPLRWRINSGNESICTSTTVTSPSPSCKDPSDWSSLTVPAASSKPIFFRVPDTWFATFSSDPRRPAQLELLYGENEKSPSQTIPLTLELRSYWYQAAGLWMYVRPFFKYVGQLAIKAVWVFIGAVLLMSVQVIIPGFRKCLLLENQLDMLRDRFSSLGNCVGTRLYSRCRRELGAVRAALYMKEQSTVVTNPLVRQVRRLALFTNSAELARLESLVRGLETRIELTEKLNEIRIERQSSAAHLTPLSIRRKLEEQLRSVETMLGRQIIAEADARRALELLNDTARPASVGKEFSDDIDGRILQLRKQLECSPWK